MDYIQEDQYNCKGCREDGLTVGKRCGITQEKFDNKPHLLDNNRMCIECGHKYGVHPAGVGQGVVYHSEQEFKRMSDQINTIASGTGSIVSKVDSMSVKLGIVQRINIEDHLTNRYDTYDNINISEVLSDTNLNELEEKKQNITGVKSPDAKQELVGMPTKVKKYYFGKEVPFCMLSGEVNIKVNITGKDKQINNLKVAHIIPHNVKKPNGEKKQITLSNLYGFKPEDIDDPRNLLVLRYDIEQAFDMLRLCFIYYPNKGQFLCHIIDWSLPDDITIFNNKPLQYPLSNNKPFISAIHHHAMCASVRAVFTTKKMSEKDFLNFLIILDFAKASPNHKPLKSIDDIKSLLLNDTYNEQ